MPDCIELSLRLTIRDELVQEVCAKALGCRCLDDDDVVVPALARCLATGPYIRARCAAADALGAFGEKALPALDVLKVQLRDGDRSVREAVTNAVLKIVPKAAAGARYLNVMSQAMQQPCQ
jgi:HEAT repeat protein